MNRRHLLPLGLVVVGLAGCGSHPTPPGEALARQACRSTGAAAAGFAARAAAANPAYAKLAGDTTASEAGQATQQNELSDGTDDSGLSALTGAQAVGTTAGQKVLADCVSLGLPVH